MMPRMSFSVEVSGRVGPVRTRRAAVGRALADERCAQPVLAVMRWFE